MEHKSNTFFMNMDPTFFMYIGIAHFRHSESVAQKDTRLLYSINEGVEGGRTVQQTSPIFHSIIPNRYNYGLLCWLNEVVFG